MHLFIVWCPLTHYQTTNFRLFQTERVCRRQFQIWRKWRKVIQTGRKHCGKRRNCSLRAISPFPTVFSKRLVSKRRQKVSLCGNGLRNPPTPSKTRPHRYTSPSRAMSFCLQYHYLFFTHTKVFEILKYCWLLSCTIASLYTCRVIKKHFRI